MTTEAQHHRVARAAWETAGKLVQGDRHETHGDFVQNLLAIAELWEGYFAARFNASIELKGSDVAHMMVLMKIARTMNGNHNPDDYVDAIGYATIAAGMADFEQD